MSVPKLRALPQNKPEKAHKDQSLQEKMDIEALKQRLVSHFNQNPAAAKKAALILESWLQEKSKK